MLSKYSTMLPKNLTMLSKNLNVHTKKFDHVNKNLIVLTKNLIIERDITSIIKNLAMHRKNFCLVFFFHRIDITICSKTGEKSGRSSNCFTSELAWEPLEPAVTHLYTRDHYMVQLSRAFALISLLRSSVAQANALC